MKPIGEPVNVSRFDKHEHLSKDQREALVLVGQSNFYSDDVIDLCWARSKPKQWMPCSPPAGVDDFTVFNVAARAAHTDSELTKGGYDG